MTYTNAQILAAVVSEWARPAIAQIASSNLMRIPVLQSLQATIGSLGLVSGDYSLAGDIQPFIKPVINSLVQPVLTHYFANIPDESIPQMAHDIVKQMKTQGTISILEGVVTFEDEDIDELADLINKNLPVATDTEAYQVIH